MDATAALSELLALSTQVVEVVIDGPGGAIEVVHAAAATLRPSGPEVERVQVDLERGSLVAVRGGGRTIVATTVPEPTAGLVAFDLRTMLRRVAEGAA
jgi:hypothetical protein